MKTQLLDANHKIAMLQDLHFCVGSQSSMANRNSCGIRFRRAREFVRDTNPDFNSLFMFQFISYHYIKGSYGFKSYQSLLAGNFNCLEDIKKCDFTANAAKLGFLGSRDVDELESFKEKF